MYFETRCAKNKNKTKRLKGFRTTNLSTLLFCDKVVMVMNGLANTHFTLSF